MSDHGCLSTAALRRSTRDAAARSPRPRSAIRVGTPARTGRSRPDRGSSPARTATSATSPRRDATGRRHRRAEPPLVEHLLAGDHPGDVADLGVGRRGQHVVDGARRGVQPPEPALTRLEGRPRQQLRRRRHDAGRRRATCPWSAVTSSAAPGGSASSTSPTSRSAASQLGVVVRRRSRARGRSCRCRRSRRTRTAPRPRAGAAPRRRSTTPRASRPASHPRRCASVNAEPSQLGRADHRHGLAEERLERLRPRAAGATGAPAGRRTRPAQHVQDLAAEHDPVPDQAVLAGRQPGGDRASTPSPSSSARRCGSGHPTIDASVGISVAVLLQLIPAEPVEHQQHDLLGPSRTGSGIHAGSAVRPRRRTEQRRHDATNVGTGVVRNDRAVTAASRHPCSPPRSTDVRDKRMREAERSHRPTE